MDGDDLVLANGAMLPAALVRERATTGGGPGGQHVNRSATRVELRVNVDDLPLTARERERVRERLGRRIGADGDLRVTASNRRSQLQNREAARARLVELLDEALAVDPPRVADPPVAGCAERRAARSRARAAPQGPGRGARRPAATRRPGASPVGCSRRGPRRNPPVRRSAHGPDSASSPSTRSRPTRPSRPSRAAATSAASAGSMAGSSGVDERQERAAAALQEQHRAAVDQHDVGAGGARRPARGPARASASAAP